MKEEIKKFYRKTKFNFKNQDKSLDPSEWPYLWKKVFYKVYERFKTINLNEPSEDKSEFEKILYSRRTTREFSEEALDFDIFSNLLNASVGISYNKEGIDFARRTYPSAGARYPIEAYIINNNIQSLEKGLYHYNVKDSNLELMLKTNLIEQSQEILNGDLGKAAALIILSGVIGRSEVKYGINAYRFSLIEAGHIGQNISLFCESKGLGSCAIGGFDNDKLSKLLDLTEEEIPLYMFAIGGKNEH